MLRPPFSQEPIPINNWDVIVVGLGFGLGRLRLHRGGWGLRPGFPGLRCWCVFPLQWRPGRRPPSHADATVPSTGPQWRWPMIPAQSCETLAGLPSAFAPAVAFRCCLHSFPVCRPLVRIRWPGPGSLS